MGFSTALKLADLNDFIAPSQACVVSLNSKKIEDDGGSVKIHSRVPSSFDQTKNVAVEKPVKVTLHDCLACSGCITSAETVMLEHQSIEEFLNRLSDSGKSVIVSLSPQSRASLAAYYGLSQLQVFRKLTGFLKSLGVKAVFDTSCSRDLSLIESCVEFVNRYKERQLPVVTSACPGWICYAEKTLDAEILPYISRVKSPQQAMGAVLKRHACYALGLRPEDVYHVTVMPCYDKKLEASRDDFIFAVENGASGLAEVDSVLTSGEILDLLQSRDIDFMSLEEQPLDKLLTNVDEQGHLYGVPGGSGGYAECVFKYAAKHLFGAEPDRVEFQVVRNADFREVKLEVDGEVRLKFALAYGFRNIQNLVRKIRLKKCEYQYVEIMACPSGCLNGGGQIKPKEGQSAKELIQNLESAYLQEVEMKDPFDNPIVKSLYDSWLGEPASLSSKRVLSTEYHHREKNVTSQLANW
ncbi:protein NAR1 [Selaginella moellendorffii]|uniref:protein NAR1 n=1 Tax=Selaginella moellendorffii TaxID=88036 RepID=UPI000D1C269A|nr:protein NAR1 [Selaginella moellendorffii]|eukprot:XP_024524681.1 protein NAR1 [Selaginella moellendorffii]